MNYKKGISLIALIVTIIVLLILAAVSIGLLIGKDSTTSKAIDSKIDGRYATIIDKVKIRENELALDEYRGEKGSTAQEFVESLITDNLLIISDKIGEDKHELDYSVIYIGRREDGTYKYTINIIELEEDNTTTGNIIFTFNLNGGSIGGSTADRTTSGAVGTPSSTPGTPNRAQYTFAGWNPSVPSTFDNNQTFIAKWSPILYTFTFQLNGGSIGGSTADRTTSGASGTPSSTPGTPNRADYTFDGWSPSVPSTFNGNRTFTAQWTPAMCGFTFNLNGGNKDGSTANIVVTGIYGSTVTIPTDIIRTGYMFIGWTPEVPSTFNGNKTFTAIWSCSMEIEVRKATTSEQVLIPITFLSGDSALISIDNGTPVEYTIDNPLLTINKPVGTSINIKIAGRINQFNYRGKLEIYRNQMYELIKWGELNIKVYNFYKCQNLQGFVPSPESNSFVETTSFNETFYECSNLLGSIPADLFANCLKVTSFHSAFRSCSNLTGSIPAGLFANCPNVTTFYSTFYKCSGLTEIPIGLFANCPNVKNFIQTFYSCSGLTGISAGLFDNCPEVTSFYWTFASCNNLIENIPVGLFDNCPEVTNFENTFYNCSGLTEIPVGLFDNCTQVTSFSQTFSNCSSLTEIPIGLFDNCLKVTTFYSTFDNCSGLTEIPIGLFDNCLNVTSFYSTFYYCSGLTGSIPIGLFDNCTEVTTFNDTFYGCSSLTGSIPAGLFDNCSEVTTFSNTFRYCSNLTGSIPLDLFDNCLKVTTFYSTFDNCSGLTGDAPPLWETHSGATSHLYCFTGCSGLANRNEIPQLWGGDKP